MMLRLLHHDQTPQATIWSIIAGFKITSAGDGKAIRHIQRIGKRQRTGIRPAVQVVIGDTTLLHLVEQLAGSAMGSDGHDSLRTISTARLRMREAMTICIQRSSAISI